MNSTDEAGNIVDNGIISLSDNELPTEVERSHNVLCSKDDFNSDNRSRTYGDEVQNSTSSKENIKPHPNPEHNEFILDNSDQLSAWINTSTKSNAKTYKKWNPIKRVRNHKSNSENGVFSESPFKNPPLHINHRNSVEQNENSKHKVIPQAKLELLSHTKPSQDQTNSSPLDPGGLNDLAKALPNTSRRTTSSFVAKKLIGAALGMQLTNSEDRAKHESILRDERKKRKGKENKSDGNGDR
jgi:hypothetical protein